MLTGRTPLITGGSRGLGRAVAQQFIENGAQVALVARECDALRDAAELIAHGSKDVGGRVSWRGADVSQPDEIAAMVEWAHATLGRIDILVCSAGIPGALGAAESVPWDQWRAAIEVNLFGTVLCCRNVVRIMQRQGWGKIITISGGRATAPQPGLSAYAASKAAVVRFTEALAWELKTSKIDINAVAPGTLNTRLLDELLAAGPQVVDATLSGRSLDAQRAGAPLQPTVDLITFLASTKSDGISGRLISAIWNDWQNVPDRMTELEDSDLFTLRHYLWSVISGLYRKYLIEQLSPRFQSGTDVPLPVR